VEKILRYGFTLGSTGEEVSDEGERGQTLQIYARQLNKLPNVGCKQLTAEVFSDAPQAKRLVRQSSRFPNTIVPWRVNK